MNQKYEVFEPFEKLCKYYSSVANEYRSSFECLEAQYLDQVVRREYSKGGLCIHGGYYSPCSMGLVCKGLSRGRLYKKNPKAGTYNYEYWFDEQDRMICYKKYDIGFTEVFKPLEVEYFVYTDEFVLGLNYAVNITKDLRIITRCWYDSGLLTRYEKSLLIPKLNGKRELIPDEYNFEIDVENLEYSCDRLFKSLFCQVYMTPDILQQNKYTFKRDSKGELSTYTAEEFNKFGENKGDVREYEIWMKNGLAPAANVLQK